MILLSQVLCHYDAKKTLKLAYDASSYGLGAVSFHQVNNKEHPVAFALRKMPSAEKNYSHVEREALAIFGIKKFYQYLWGRKFTLETDHKPLTAIFGPKQGVPAMAAARLHQRWAVILSGYSYEIVSVSYVAVGSASTCTIKKEFRDPRKCALQLHG